MQLSFFLYYAYMYTVSGKKSLEYFRHNFIKYWPIFFIFFYCYNLQEICNKVSVKYPTTP